MRRIFKSPAERLGSVHCRYHQPLFSPAHRGCAFPMQTAAIFHAIAADPGKDEIRPVRALWENSGEYRPPDDLVRDEKLARLEAVLFLAKEPLPAQKLSKFASLANAKEALTLVSRLNDLYDHAARAFRVHQVAGGWQLRTRPQFGKWLRRLAHVPREIRLSAPSMETLAVVAYRQPVLRAEIEEVRGVGCGEILRQLMERDLVRVSGRSDELGRPYFYSTTQHFLQVFGLRDLEELPRAESFRQSLEENNEAGELATLATDGDEEVAVTFNDNSLSPDADASVVTDVAVKKPTRSTGKPCRKVRNSIDDDDEEEDDGWNDDDEGGWDDDDEDLEEDYEFEDELGDDEEWVEDDDEVEEDLEDDEEWVEVEDDEELDGEWDDDDDDEEEDYEYEDDDYDDD